MIPQVDRLPAPRFSRSPPIQVPSEIVQKWQEIVDLLAEIMCVPSALVMRVEPPNIKVFASSESKGNPYEQDEVASLNTGLYCETVMKTRQPLLVPDALEDEEWKSNPDIKLGMISYLGLPVTWPNGEIFGTICVLDNKKNEYSELYRRLLLHCRDVLQADLRSLTKLGGELTTQRAHLDELFARVPEGIVLLDVSGRVVRVNPEFTKIFGYSEEEVLGRPLNDLIVPEELRAEAEQSARRLNHRGEIATAETVRSRKNGTRVSVSIERVPVTREGSQISEYAIYRDITESKRAEEALQEQANLLNLTHDAILVRDMNGVIKYWNRGAEELYGWTAEQAAGKPTRELLKTVFPVPLEQIEAEILRAGRWDGELVQRKRDGTQIVVLSRWSLQRDEQAAPVAILVTNNDITERKRAEEALRQAQADLAHINRVTTMGELASSLAHELNQPIAAAITNANTCLRWLAQADLEEAREAATRIVKDGTRAAEIISRFRSFYKKSVPQREPVDLNQIVSEMLVLLRSEANRYSISMRTDLGTELPKVMADRVQLQQVFMNLMLNGIEAMKDTAGELRIESQLGQESQLLISVSDTGVGLPSGQADQIFNAFFTTKPGGTGMGLPISRSIVESHGGRLWAAANPGPGTTFSFTLPTQGEAHE